MDKLGSIVFNFHSFVSADDFGSEINSSQSEGMCILLFKIQKFPNYVINMQNKLDQILPLLILV